MSRTLSSAKNPSSGTASTVGLPEFLLISKESSGLRSSKKLQHFYSLFQVSCDCDCLEARFDCLRVPTIALFIEVAFREVHIGVR